MNNDVSPKVETTTRSKILGFLGTILCFLIGLAVIIGVKSCIRDSGMPDAFKDAKTLLEKEGFSIRYMDDESKIREKFSELDVDAYGVTEVLIALDEDTEDFFIVAYCDDVTAAENLEFEFSYLLSFDDYLYYRGYTSKVNYRMVYFGHKDIISALLK